MSHHYISFENLSFSYPKGPEVLHDINLRITHGERVALLGLNGSGKSTLLLQTNGLLFPSSGRVVVGDVPVTRKTAPEVRRRVGMVFQNPDDMLFMPTVADDVAFGPRNMKLPELEVARRVNNALEAVGIPSLASSPTFMLSGGQRRAAAIATVLSMEPDILVLDEPSANLDMRACKALVKTLSEFNHTILLATHDLELARNLTPRAILLHEGRVLADTSLDEAIGILSQLADSH